MPRMAGLLIGIMYEEASPTDTLQLLFSLPPRQVSIRSFHRRCQEAQQDSWQANLHIPYAFLLSSASAMRLFFFLFSNYVLHWNSTSSLQNDSTWISPWDSPNILVKQVGAGNFPIKYGRGNRGKTIYSRILSFQVTR